MLSQPGLAFANPTTPNALRSPEFHGFQKTRARAITHYFPFAQKIDLTADIDDDGGDCDGARDCHVDDNATAAATDYVANGGCQRTDADEEHNTLVSSPSPPMSVYDENACDAFDLLVCAAENAAASVFHANATDTENIFLQTPVLHLNIDRSPNQASSITINKHNIEVMSNFAAALTANNNNNNNNHHNAVAGHNEAASNKNGGHGGAPGGSAAGSETDRSDDDGHVTRSPSTVSAPESSDYISSDSNSCDSGVVADRRRQLQLQQQQQQQFQQQQQQQPQQFQQQQPPHPTSPSKRRKPMTPHRILCPSPDKRTDEPAALSVNAVAAESNVCSTPKSGYAVPSVVSHSPQLQQSPTARRRKTAAVKSLKTRRRLNGRYVATDSPQKGHKSGDKKAQARIEASANAAVAETIIDVDAVHIEDGGNHTKNPTESPEQRRPSGEQPPIVHTKVSVKGSHALGKSKTTTATAAAAPAPRPKDKLTDFFPVRRSVRKTKKAVEQEQLHSIEAAIRNQQEDGLLVAEFPHKGRGIMAARRFERGEFVVEYIGDLIDMPEANRRELLYAKDENTGCYMYYFKHSDQQYW